MNTQKFIVLVMIIICFHGCAENSTNESLHKEFYPLSVGNYWHYQTIVFDSVGTVSSEGPIWAERIIGDTSMYGVTWYLMEQKELNSSSYLIAPYRNTSEGFMRTTDSVIFKYPLIYKYPAAINEVFSDSITVVAVNETITSIAGTMKCVVYMQKIIENPFGAGWIYMKTYVAPGFGKVKMEAYITTDKKVFMKRGEYRLIEYHIH